MSRSPLPGGLIINADDLGIHPSIDAGILSAYERGVLTSCTMLMTTQFRDRTVRDYVRPAKLPIGIHLSLTLGKAVAPADKVPDLVDAAGNLKLRIGQLFSPTGSSKLALRLLGQIRRELEAQIALACDVGLKPTHVDSHQHAHMSPAVFSVVEDLLPRYGITRVRFCRERLSPQMLSSGLMGAVRRKNPAKWLVLRLCERRITPRLAAPERSFGVFHSGMFTAATLASMVESIRPDESVEIGVHPGFPAPPGETPYPTRPAYNAFITSPARRMEHDLLITDDLRDLIRRRGLSLRDFSGRVKG